MSLSATLSTALSGLTAASRSAELTSSNVANALTPGYTRRLLEIGQRQVGNSGTGVAVLGVTRHVDRALLADRRLAGGAAAERDLRAGFLASVETALGSPDDAASLTARVAALDAALIAAASRPDSEVRLGEVLHAAQAIITRLAAAGTVVQQARAAADNHIAVAVAEVNINLARVADLNAAIRSQQGAGRDASALMDQRQSAIDAIALVMPLREMDREDGQIALYTTTGATLLDGKPAELGFAPVGVVTAEMTLGSGALSGLTLNGRSFTASGGSLAGQFALRDTLAPAAQARLDAVARDLIGRFADPATDPSLAPGAPGLFTDAGAALLPGAEVGLAQRMSINALADPAQGGALWRLRAGLGAASPGEAGDSRQINRLQSALLAEREPASGGFLPGARSFAGLAADLVSTTAAARLTAESEASFANARADALTVLELENGVDTDQEMQTLMLVERAYAANAKVVQTVDELMKILLGL